MRISGAVGEGYCLFISLLVFSVQDCFSQTQLWMSGMWRGRLTLVELTTWELPLPVQLERHCTSTQYSHTHTGISSIHYVRLSSGRDWLFIYELKTNILKSNNSLQILKTLFRCMTSYSRFESYHWRVLSLPTDLLEPAVATHSRSREREDTSCPTRCTYCNLWICIVCGA